MSQSNKPTVAIVSPCFNEAEVVGLFHVELTRVLDATTECDFKIYYVDDGSEDTTLSKLQALADRDDRVTVLSLSRNFGHQAALFAGLETAEADAVITMDSDLQHPPSWIPKMIAKWRDGADIVSMVRKATEDASWFKRTSSWLFYRFLNAISDTKVIPGASDFMLLSRQAKEAMVSLPDRHLFIRGMVSWIGFERSLLPYSAPPRAAGKSKYGFAKMLSLSLNAVFSFSVKPITLAIRLGGVVISLSLLYFLYITTRYVLYGDLVKGWASLAVLMLFMGGVQLCFIGLIGQYLGRVFEQVKGRPRYYLKTISRTQTKRLAA